MPKRENRLKAAEKYEARKLVKKNQEQTKDNTAVAPEAPRHRGRPHKIQE